MLHAGDGFSTRAEDSILHECIPTIIMDNVDPVFSSILDWGSFSVRIAEVVIPHLSGSHKLRGHMITCTAFQEVCALGRFNW